jgi:hypothetical protein
VRKNTVTAVTGLQVIVTLKRGFAGCPQGGQLCAGPSTPHF